jgi:hypothetical protein
MAIVSFHHITMTAALHGVNDSHATISVGKAFTERFWKLLLLGSIVFKQTQYREWHTERIQPYVDYIPITTSLDDLEDKLQYYANHYHVGRHGRATALQYLRPVDQQCYMYRLMIEYGRLF